MRHGPQLAGTEEGLVLSTPGLLVSKDALPLGGNLFVCPRRVATSALAEIPSSDTCVSKGRPMVDGWQKGGTNSSRCSGQGAGVQRQRGGAGRGTVQVERRFWRHGGNAAQKAVAPARKAQGCGSSGAVPTDGLCKWSEACRGMAERRHRQQSQQPGLGGGAAAERRGGQRKCASRPTVVEGWRIGGTNRSRCSMQGAGARQQRGGFGRGTVQIDRRLRGGWGEGGTNSCSYSGRGAGAPAVGRCKCIEGCRGRAAPTGRRRKQAGCGGSRERADADGHVEKKGGGGSSDCGNWIGDGEGGRWREHFP